MIDWEYLWQTHCPHFKNGIATITMPNGRSFKMKAGPGFGDGSHQTTNLLLTLLPNVAPNQTIVDIGTGTAILALAAITLGAKKVYAFEIDSDSIEHAKENIALNHMEECILLNSEAPSHSLVMINMISSEQEIALQQYPCLKRQTPLLASGLLTTEETSYRKKFPNHKLQKTITDGEWLAMHLTLASR